MNTKSKLSVCRDDRVLYTVIIVFMLLFLVVILYPLIYVVSSSFSSGQAVAAGKVLLLPVEFTTIGYRLVFSYSRVWTGYKNTLIYTFVGTLLDLVLTTMVAYPLSRRKFQGRTVIMTYYMITMFFSGGIIPTYILVTKLGLTNSRWAIILSQAINVYNLVIMRTFFQNSIPEELHEAAVIDGITDIGYLFKVVIPLSKAIFAVITLYYAVHHWNSYFSAMMYLRDRDLYPLQMVLRDILNASRVDLTQVTDSELLKQLMGASDVMRYSLIVVSAAPILLGYPIVQKFFEKGVMIGSVKG